MPDDLSGRRAGRRGAGCADARVTGGRPDTVDAYPVPLREFGPLHVLAERAFDLLQRGEAEGAERAGAVAAALAEAVGDEPTLRYCLHVRARALIALHRAWEAVALADVLAERAAHDAQPFWRAKALAVRALALRAVGGHDIVDLLAEAWVLTGTPDGRVYNQVSAAVLIATTLRSTELYEQSDALLSRLWRVVPQDIAVTVLVDGARTLAEWGVHRALVADPGAGATFARLASHTELLRRSVPPDSAWTGLPAFVRCFQAVAAHGLGDLPAAAVLIRSLRRHGWPHRASPEWFMATYVAGSLACTAGSYGPGTADLHDLRAVAEAHGHQLWAAAADEALVRADAERYGPHPALAHAARLFRRSSARWAEQQAERFDAVRTRMRLHELLVERDRARVLSRVDALTGVGNRRALQDRLATGTGPLSALFVDVDDFKAVNEAHSHVTGDAVLIEVARLLHAAARPGDVLARYGGDEFVLVLADGGADQPAARAEAVVHAVREHDWSALAPGLAVTVSVGTAHERDRAALLSDLSAAVHAAKRAGRDRSVPAQRRPARLVALPAPDGGAASAQAAV